MNNLWINSLAELSFDDSILALAAALGCGMLIGIERERHNVREHKVAVAGFRTYVLVSLLGALSFLFGVSVGIAGLLFTACISLISHFKNNPQSPGVTSEVALVISYLIGALCLWQPLMATSFAVVTTLILMGKDALHNFANRWLTEQEMKDGTLLLALALIALPLMPNKPYWGTVLNPYVTVRLLILILMVQAVAHLAKRLLSLSHAMSLSSLASGFVSSTATVASLGLQVRKGIAPAKVNAGGALISCVATLLQFIVVASGSNIAWLKVLILPIIAGSLVGMGWGLWLIGSPKKAGIFPSHPPNNVANNLDNNNPITLRATHDVLPANLPASANAVKSTAHSAENNFENNLAQNQLASSSRMFSLKEAAMVAVALTVIQVFVYGLGQLLGKSGILVGTLLASIFEIHAAMAAVFLQGAPVLSFQNTLMLALIVGMTVHAIAKSINAVLTGGWQYGKYFIPGLWVQTLLFNGILIATIIWL